MELEITGRSNHEAALRSDLRRDQRAVLQMADTDNRIEPLDHRIGQSFGQVQFDAQVGCCSISVCITGIT